VARPRSSPTLTRSFREFMPQWLARQQWYLGAGVPVLRPVGAFRLEDPDGEAGIETQLVSDGDEIYQIPDDLLGRCAGEGGAHRDGGAQRARHTLDLRRDDRPGLGG
jgi:hypothetical protein